MEHSNLTKSIGVLALLTAGLACVIGLIVISNKSQTGAMLYLGIIIVSPFLILRFFCTKCPCTGNCAHVIPGILTKKLFKNREGPYTSLDISIFGITVLALFGFPQIWLIENVTFLVIFWILLAITGISVIVVLCKQCDNVFCPLNKLVKTSL